jgi:carbonic anhydrase/acetyltransferase-like protein (isoleucine patch superfamily)
MSAVLLPFRDKKPDVAAYVYLAPTVSLVGDVRIGACSSIWFGCTLRGDVNYIQVGKGSNIQDHSMIHVSSFGHPCIIGDDVTVGHMALLHACTVEDKAFIGMKACVMDGAVIQPEAMVAAGALVPPGKTVPSGELWAGAPARFMRKLEDKDFEYMSWSSTHYQKLAKEYLT